MPFQPGNKLGARSRTVERLMLSIIGQEAETLPPGRQRIPMMVNAILDLASQGERWACEFVRDTLDGKPHQSVDARVDMSVSDLGILARQAADQIIQAVEDEPQP